MLYVVKLIHQLKTSPDQRHYLSQKIHLVPLVSTAAVSFETTNIPKETAPACS